MNIGKQLKKLRKTKGMTLEELAEKSGVAMATLSRMENDKMPGTLNAHKSICAALGSSLSDLYREIEDEDKTVDPVPQAARTEHYSHESGLVCELLISKITDKKVTPLMLHLGKNCESAPETSKHGSEKFIYVISGSFDAIVGKTVYPLKEGDSLYFDASLPHYLRNKGRSAATAICVIAR